MVPHFLAVFMAVFCLSHMGSSYPAEKARYLLHQARWQHALMDRRNGWVPGGWLQHVKDYPEVDIIGHKHVTVKMDQRNVKFACKLDYIYSEQSFDILYGLRKSYFNSWIEPTFSNMKVKKQTRERVDLYKMYKNKDDPLAEAKKSFTHATTVQFPPIQFKHARKYNCAFSFRLMHSGVHTNAAKTVERNSFSISLYDFVIKQRIIAIGFGSKPLVYQTSPKAKKRSAIFSVGSDVTRYQFSCDCKEGKGEQLKYIRAAWKFHHKSRVGSGRVASELPRGVIASRISYHKLRMRITRLQDSIEGWYHCEWRSLRAWNHPYSSPEFKLIPYDDDSCQVIGAVKKTSLCHKDATCIDTRFSYHCVCNDGFTGDGKKYCDDIDECSRGIHRCDVNAQCINNVGDYRCQCDQGYKGNGWTCSLSDFDIDEILKIDYYGEQYNKTNIDLKDKYLADDVIFDWGKATEPPHQARNPTAKIAPIGDEGTSSLTGIIAGAAIGIVSLLAATAAVICYCQRRTQRKLTNESDYGFESDIISQSESETYSELQGSKYSVITDRWKSEIDKNGHSEDSDSSKSNQGSCDDTDKIEQTQYRSDQETDRSEESSDHEDKSSGDTKSSLINFCSSTDDELS